MLRKSSHVGVVFSIALLVLVVGCGGGGDQADSASRDESWVALEAAHQNLTDTRAEIADLRLQLLEAQVAEAAEPAEPAEPEAVEEAVAEEGAIVEEGMQEAAAEPMTAEEIQTKIEQLDAALTTKSDDFGMHLVEFINADPVYQGEEPSERQNAAFHLKSAEDIILGQEYIDMGGDYKRAIEIFESALLIDGDNPDLIAALEKANADRYMTEERFAQVTVGMGQEQVLALRGQVFH